MQLLQRVPRRVLAGIVVLMILVILGLGGITLIKTNKSISSKLSNSTTNTTNELGTNIEFRSQISGVSVSIDAKGRDALKNYLQKLNLLPLSHKPFIGGFLGYTAIITPSKVIVEFRDLSQEKSDLAKDTNLIKRKLLEEQNFDAYYVGDFNKNTQELTIPVYVNKNNLNKNPDIFLTQIALESIFLNFRDTSIQVLGSNPTDAFYKIVGNVNTPVVMVK